MTDYLYRLRFLDRMARDCAENFQRRQRLAHDPTGAFGQRHELVPKPCEVLFHSKAADRTAHTTVAVLKMRAWPSGSEELVLDLKCEVPHPALDFDEVPVGGGDGTPA
jgi:hypothetical protein